MKIDEVPQDAAILDHNNTVSYAVQEDGSYVLIPSAGWDAANLANIQAWEVIDESIKEALEKIATGLVSPLAFHMAKNQMDIGLLASYVKLPRWRIKRHLKSKIYKKLPERILNRYATVFSISIEELDSIPSIEDIDGYTFSTQEND